DICHNFADCWIAPEQAVNQRLAERIDRRMVTEQPMVRSGRDHMTIHVLDMYNAIPLNPERTDACMIQLLTTHRLYRVPPKLRHLHDRNLPRILSDQHSPSTSRPLNATATSPPLCLHSDARARALNTSPSASSEPFFGSDTIIRQFS